MPLRSPLTIKEHVAVLAIAHLETLAEDFKALSLSFLDIARSKEGKEAEEAFEKAARQHDKALACRELIDLLHTQR